MSIYINLYLKKLFFSCQCKIKHKYSSFIVYKKFIQAKNKKADHIHKKTLLNFIQLFLFKPKGLNVKCVFNFKTILFWYTIFCIFSVFSVCPWV